MRSYYCYFIFILLFSIYWFLFFLYLFIYYFFEWISVVALSCECICSDTNICNKITQENRNIGLIFTKKSIFQKEKEFCKLPVNSAVCCLTFNRFLQFGLQSKSYIWKPSNSGIGAWMKKIIMLMLFTYEIHPWNRLIFLVSDFSCYDWSAFCQTGIDCFL